MRVIKDGLGNVRDKQGNILHTGVRILWDDKKRIAVFAGKNKNPPIAVYGPDDGVTADRSGGCPTCKGWPARQSMWKVWMDHDKVTA